MIISYLGHSCFRLQDKTGPDGVSVVCDPFDSTVVGLKMPRLEADIVTISHDHKDHNNLAAIGGEPFVISGAGEFETKNVFVEGVLTKHGGSEAIDNFIYRIDIDGITVVHCGDLGHLLETKQLEKLDNTDILLIPVGGTYTLNAKLAAEVVNQIEPRIVIPMHYGQPDLKIKLDSVENFIKEIGLPPRREDKLKISKRDLPLEDTELYILNI